MDAEPGRLTDAIRAGAGDVAVLRELRSYSFPDRVEEAPPKSPRAPANVRTPKPRVLKPEPAPLPHVCIKPSARQNKLPVGTEHVCHGCGTVWVVSLIDGKRIWTKDDVQPSMD